MKLNDTDLPSVLRPYIRVSVNGIIVTDRCQSVEFEDSSVLGPTMTGKGTCVCLVPSSQGGWQTTSKGVKTEELKGAVKFEMFSTSPKIEILWQEYVKKAQAGSAGT